ncbi:MAG TPA: VCBS repeat-containing protein [Terriglobales bacterium]|nr:VCBS repeat-containing protein [Terriglobales bacterium]
MKRTAWTFLLVVATLSVGADNASAQQFKKAVYYHAAGNPWTLVAAHFTKSGNFDLAVADLFQGRVAILLGNGDGTFQPPRTFPVTNPVEIATGDFNEDGNEDLAVTESNGTGDGSLAIFLGDGKGSFKLSASYPIGVVSGFVAVADFNGDGHLDAAVTDQGFDGTLGDVIVFFGNGQGKLNRVAKFKMPQQPVGIAAGDLNGDHSPDLAVTLAGSGSVAVFLNDGMGKFRKPVTYNAGGGAAVDVKIADLRNHGKQDLVVANGSQGMVVLLNKGDGTFGKPTIYPPLCQNCVAPSACVVADFNLDGKLDVACATNIDDSYFFYGDGKGSFGAINPIHDTIQNQGGFSIAAGDFNNDKAPDLAIPIQNNGKVAIMINTQ